MAGLSVRNLTRRPAPAFAFDRALRQLPGWEVSLVFVGRDRARKLNRTLRGKSYVPNVLSYATGKKSGEVVICLEVAKRQAPAYGMRYPVFAGFLFIHALLHLEGYRHGSTMDEVERRRLYRLVPHYAHETPHRNRDRHRNRAGKGRRR